MNKIALAPTSLPSADAFEYVAAAKSAGYEAMGLRVFRSPGITYAFHPITGDKQRENDVAKAIADSGIEVYDALSFYMQPEMDLDSMRAPLEFAQRVGAGYALVIGDDPDWGRMVDNFGRFCDMALALGITPAIEAPVVRREINTTAKAIKLITDSGGRGAISLDPLHFYRLGETPAVLKDIDQAMFPYTQITDGPMEGGRCALGEGGAPIYGILDALTPGLPLSLEWQPPRDPAPTHAEWAKHILDYCKAYLTEYEASRTK